MKCLENKHIEEFKGIINNHKEQGNLYLNTERDIIQINSMDTETYVYIRVTQRSIQLANIILYKCRTGMGTEIIKVLERIAKDLGTKEVIIENVMTERMKKLANKLGYKIKDDNSLLPNYYKIVEGI